MRRILTVTPAHLGGATVTALALWLSLSGTAFAGDEAATWEHSGWSWGLLPAPSFNTDEGVGMGVIGSLYRYDGSTSPYKWSAGILAWMATRGVHAHHLNLDFLDLAGGPLRLSSRLRFESSKAETWCGLGGDVTCDEEEAKRVAGELGLEDEEYDDFVRRYHKHRYMMPHGLVNARWRLASGPPKVELLVGYRLTWYRTGDFSEPGPWPGSLYDRTIETDELGFTSVLQGGIVLDARDNEPSPTRGYWVEATVRGASRYLGSDWEYLGFNTTLRGYLPLLPEGRLVLADRLVLDGIVGEASSQEMTWPGGLQMYTVAGGQRSGRGMALRRYRGRVKAINQVDLRWRAVSFTPFGVDVDLWLLAFVDAVHVAEHWRDLGASPLVLGEGAGVRLAFDDNFVLRFDVGVSAVQGFAPQVYIDVDNLF